VLHEFIAASIAPKFNDFAALNLKSKERLNFKEYLDSLCGRNIRLNVKNGPTIDSSVCTLTAQW